MRSLKKEFYIVSNESGGGEKGVSLYISVIILTIMLAMVFGLSAIVTNQIKMIRGMGDSVAALYAADTGIERIIYDVRIGKTGQNFSETWGTDYNYETTTTTGGACGTKTCLQSVGTYKQTKRAIQASY